jgi:hypothetical protein
MTDGIRTKKTNALKGKGGLVALAVVVILGVWLSFDLKKPVTDPDAKPLVSEYVHAVSDEVKRVEVKRPDGGFALAKQGGRWTFERPGAYRADPESVKIWLKATLEGANVGETVEGKPGDVSTYGMDKPEYEMVLTTGAGDTRTLQVGKEFQSSGGTAPSLYYAREAKDGRLFMLPTPVVENLKGKKLDELRDKKLVELPNEKTVQRIVLQRPEGTTEFQRRGEDKWDLLQPYHAPADETIAQGLVSELKAAEAESFVDNAAADLAKYGLDKPRLTVQVTDKSGPHGVLFGAAEKSGKVYAVRQGEREVTLVPRATFDSLNKTPSDLREKKLITFDKDKISYVELKNAQGSTRLQKVGGKEWQITDPGDPKPKKAKAEMVERVLDTITISATKHVEEAPADLAKYGLDKPAISVQVNDGSGTSQVFSVGKKAGENYYAKGAPNAVFEVGSFAFGDLNVKPEAFRDAGQKK